MLTRRGLLARAAQLGSGAFVASLLGACQATPPATSGAPTAVPPAAPKPTSPPAPATQPAATQPAVASKPAAGRRGGTLRVSIETDVATLDPHLSTRIVDRYALYGIFNTLVGTDENFSPQPELAESWSNPDPKTYEFKLRADAKFHDGTPFDASVVKWNIERLKDPATKSPYASQLAPVQSIEAVDPRTVRFKLSEPFAPLLSLMMDRPGFMLSPTAVQKSGADFGRNPVGTGPYRFVQWTPGQGITLERNAEYWNPAHGLLDKIELKIVPDVTVRVTQLRTGELDLIDRFDARDAPKIQAESNLKLVEAPGGIWWAVQFHVDEPPFDNKLVRQGIGWAINRDALAKANWGGYGKAPRAPVTLPLGGPDSVTPLGYDPAKAKALLAQSGVANLSDTLNIAVPDQRLAELIQAQLGEVGFQTQLQPVPPDDWLARLNSNKQHWTITNWTQRPDPHGLLSLVFATKGGANNMGYSNPQVDDLIARAAATYDASQRRTLYTQAQQTIVDDAPMVYLWSPSFFYGLNKNVEGLRAMPDNVLRVAPLSLSA
jgi:peptide/nickel transport system substrate-binding protein